MAEILMPDIRTVLMMQMLVGFLFTAVFALTWSQGEGGRSAGLWAIGHGLVAAALILWVLRGVLPPILSMAVANVVIHTGSLLICWGIWLEAGRRFPAWALPPVILIDAVLFVFFTVVQPDAAVRSALGSFPVAAVFLSGGIVLLFDRHPGRRRVSRWAALAVGTLGVLHTLRFVLVLIYGLPDTPNPDAQHGGIFLLFLIISVGSDIALLWVRTAAWRHAMVLEVESRRRSEAALVQAKEAAEQAAQAKSRFLANMSHEIRTPLNAVIGLSRLLTRTRLDDRQRVHAARITTAADTLLHLIDGVLDAARLEAGRVQAEETDFVLADLLDRVNGILAPAAEAKGLAFVMTLDDAVPTAVRGDGARLCQILVNIAGNAVKFSETGAVTLSVTAVQPPDTGSERILRFTIRDNGPGIAPEQLPFIFEPFHQAGPEIGRRYGGTGLGLAIARQSAGLMGGDITVDSAPGAGSTFTVMLPFRLAAAPAPAAAAPAALRFDGARILVVDDDEINREVAREILEQAGAAVETAADGREAVARALTPDCAIDAILMDIRMPDIDGLAATACIREVRGRTDLPIIAVTAHALDEERRQCLAAGMNDFVTKPVEPEQLLAALARWVVPRTAPAPAALPPDEAFPDAIPGFDVAATLDRFCGNTAVVRRLLEGFARRCAEAQDTLGRLETGSQRSEARNIMHGLRGAAATLGASEVARCATRLEAVLTAPDGAAVAAEAAALARALSVAAAAVGAAGIGA